jgi:hypothetical protein
MSKDFNHDDEPDYADDDLQQDNETATEGARFVKRKHGSTVDHITVSANSLDAEMLPEPDSEQEQIEVRRGKRAEDDEEHETELPRLVAPKTAKQQMSEKLAAAQANYGRLPKLNKQPANDNFRQTVLWPLMDQLTRRTFEPDDERRAKLAVTARYARELIDIVEGDSLGSSVHLPGKDTSTDYDVQRTESGSVYFEHGQTLDRRKVTIGNEDRDERFIGSARTAKKSLPVGGSGFNSNHDDPLPVRLIAAREELEVIIGYVGPLLWPSLKAVISENATMTDIGVALGVKSTQASIVGTTIIRLALTGATEALSRFNEVKDMPRIRTPMPDKSRGSFWNQSSGPVVKVAA